MNQWKRWPSSVNTIYNNVNYTIFCRTLSTGSGGSIGLGIFFFWGGDHRPVPPLAECEVRWAGLPRFTYLPLCHTFSHYLALFLLQYRTSFSCPYNLLSCWHVTNSFIVKVPSFLTYMTLSRADLPCFLLDYLSSLVVYPASLTVYPYLFVYPTSLTVYPNLSCLPYLPRCLP